MTTENERPDVDHCILSLRDPDVRVRMDAVRTLAEQGKGAVRAVPALAEALADKSFLFA
ncbi:unnamed protein product [marine sediment metagenome]|uniref:HEAT repeat domain-containing protein n=1 Tax=marine sediment metagenome TaxID=412755 RepID=X0S0C6_9ZZZZ